MTGTPHDTSPGGLIALVQEQLGLYEQLELLSVRQSALVESEDTDALLEVLNERQKLIEYITDVSARMTPYRARWDDHVNQLAESEREELRSGLDSLAAMMSSIAARDEDDRKRMQDRRDHVKNQISGVKRGGAAVKSYGQSASRGPRFQDREA